MTAPIVLFCDFGLPYTGQMKAKMLSADSGLLILDLFHDVPAHNIEAGSALLAAHTRDFPKATVFVCVVDPGVGSCQRRPGAIFADQRWFVGPLNGLFEHVVRQSEGDVQAFEITNICDDVSATFHGRDIFAPVAAKLAQGDQSDLSPIALDDIRQTAFKDDVKSVIYVDGFGNLMTGIRAKVMSEHETLEILGHKLDRAQTFSDVPKGKLLVYENNVGLMEIAAHQGRAHEMLHISALPSVKIIRAL
ncbi:MAG: SAM-dependent chlorinase/fluorinase [Magnetovibrio sp.]|nr:SAM-dependent chlorinase/fluorinase [Magnetovibrio sp.]